MKEFLQYRLNEFKQRWDLNCYYRNPDNDGTLPIPYPPLDSGELKEGEIVYFYKNNRKIKGIVMNTIIQYNYDEPEKGWIYFYDIKSNETYHNRKYRQLDEL